MKKGEKTIGENAKEKAYQLARPLNQRIDRLNRRHCTYLDR